MVPFNATVPIIQALTSTPVIQAKNPVSTPIIRASLYSIPNTLIPRTSVQETTQLVHHTPVLATSSLQFTSMTSSNKDEISKVTKAVIQASTTTPNISPTSTLSPMEEMLKKLEEGK